MLLVVTKSGEASTGGGTPSRLNSILAQSLAIRQAMTGVLELETELAALSPKPPALESLQEYTVGKMDQDFPFLKWKAFFGAAFKHLAETIHTEEELEDMEVMVQVDFLKVRSTSNCMNAATVVNVSHFSQGVNDLVEKYRASGRSEVIENYLIWRVVGSFFPDYSADSVHHRENCLKDTEALFVPAVTAMYIRAKGVDETEKVVKQVDSMVTSMKEAFRSNLPKLKWMSESSLKSAERKLEGIIDQIGFPRFVLNSTWLDTLYSVLPVSSDDHVLNSFAGKAFLKYSDVAALFAEYERGAWNDFAHVSGIVAINAYYNQVSNTVVVPIGVLQPPLFWSRPKSLTFGAFGIVVGEKLCHKRPPSCT